MTFYRSATLTSVFALMAGPALADVTAADVWANWQSLFDSYGMTLEIGEESASGGRVALSGVVLSSEFPEGTFSFELGDIEFTEAGDGTVRVTMSETVPVSIQVDDPEAGDVAIGMTLSQPGAELLVSGNAAAPRYDFNYPTMGLGDFQVEGEEVPEEFPVVADITVADLAGFMAFEEGENTPYSNAMTMASLTADIRADVPEEEGGGSFVMNFSLSDVEQTTSGTLGDVTMAMSLSEMQKAGMSQVGQATHGEATYSIAVDSPDGAFTMEGAAASGSFFANIADGGLSYGTSAKDSTISLSGDMIPFPSVNLAIAETGGTLTLPVVPGEEPQDFGLVMRLVGLEIDDMIWGIFDPAGQLPRDPATLIVDLGGQAIVSEDYTAPDYAENPNPAMPGTLEALKINALQLSLAGAELTGTGDFGFDNSMGMPIPSGQVDLMLTGGNTLIDTLVGMGLLPEEQAMGARMMLGMFARPGPGDDTLTSQIEFTPDGQVLANGQRIR